MLNVTEIAARISNPSITKANDAEDLKLLAEKYPYTQLFSILYLQSLKQAGDIHFEDELKKHSFRITDRVQLFQLIESSHAVSAEPKAEVVEVGLMEELTIEKSEDEKIEAESIELPKTQNTEVNETVDLEIEPEKVAIPEWDIHDDDVEIDEKIDDDIPAEPEIIQDEDFILPVEEILDNITPDQLVTSEFEAAEIGNIIEESAHAEIDNSQKLGSDQIDENQDGELKIEREGEVDWSEGEEQSEGERKSEGEIDWSEGEEQGESEEKSEEESEEEKQPYSVQESLEESIPEIDPLEQTIAHHVYAANYRLDGLTKEEERKLKEKQPDSSSEKEFIPKRSEKKQGASFTNWLHANSNYEAPDEASITPTIVPHFSDFDPSNPLFGEQNRPKQEFFSAPKKAKKSLTEETLPVSETLAKVYSMQGNYPKAIAAYEQLMVTIPEKKSFFASLIEELKTKLNT